MKLPEASLVLLTFLSFLGENYYYAFASPTTNAVLRGGGGAGGGRKATTRRLSPKQVNAACVDDPAYFFDRKNGTEADCAWVGKNAKRVNRYCVQEATQSRNGKSVRDACPATCDYCQIKITVAPTGAPTKFLAPITTAPPTKLKAPTMMPQSSPSTTTPPSKAAKSMKSAKSAKSMKSAKSPAVKSTDAPTDACTGAPTKAPTKATSEATSKAPSKAPSKGTLIGVQTAVQTGVLISLFGDDGKY
eukprot:scaffold2099_cov258-Chaetoceros_neogracile.AAC.7